MKLMAQVQLLPNKEQKRVLKDTVETVNRACDYISSLAWDKKVFGKFQLQKICYHEVKEKFNLSAQVVIRAIAKVVDAYKLDKKTQRIFKPHGAIAFDDRILSYKLDDNLVSIWTVKGRLKIPIVAGERQKELLKTRKGESDLCLTNDKFFLNAVCDVDEPEPLDFSGHLGVDLGVVNIATTSDGKKYSGEQIEQKRTKDLALRAKLQRKGTNSAKAKLRKLSRKRSKFQKDVNHCISKELVSDSKGHSKAIALEELKGISRNTKIEKRLRKSTRSKVSNWAFRQLRQFIEYKAQLEGVTVTTVNAKNTSCECSKCGYTDKINRKTQEKFLCKCCGHKENADVNAARNISSRADVNQPTVLRSPSLAEVGSTSLLL